MLGSGREAVRLEAIGPPHRFETRRFARRLPTDEGGASAVMSAHDLSSPRSPAHFLRRKDVLAGLLFIGFAVIGLWASRNYPIGTTTRMGTGYVPRLLCWILLGLGALVFVQGLRDAAASSSQARRSGAR